MMKKKLNNKKGFTLAELLIVVAIIGILVAISVPVFTSQLTKAKEKTDAANLRAAKAAATAAVLAEEDINNFYYDIEEGIFKSGQGTGYRKAGPADDYIIAVVDKGTVSVKWNSEAGTPGQGGDAGQDEDGAGDQ